MIFSRLVRPLRAIAVVFATAVTAGCVDLTFTYDARPGGVWARVAWTVSRTVVAAATEGHAPTLDQARALCASVTMRRAGLSLADLGFVQRPALVAPKARDPVRCAAVLGELAELGAFTPIELLAFFPGAPELRDGAWHVTPYGTFDALLQAARVAAPAPDSVSPHVGLDPLLSLTDFVSFHDAADPSELIAVLRSLLEDLRLTIVLRGDVVPDPAFVEAPDGDWIWTGRGLDALISPPPFVLHAP